MDAVLQERSRSSVRSPSLSHGGAAETELIASMKHR
jgi:hypothetical protein